MFNFSVKKEEGKNLYIKIFEGIKNAIENEEITKGEKLPPIRKAAKTLGVNTTTIVKAYDLLEREGYLYKIVGSGSYVEEIKNTRKISSEEKEAEEELWNIRSEDRGKINFAGANPSTDLFPVEEFRIAINTVIDKDGGAAFSYEESKGYKPLRDKMVDILSMEDIEADAENIQIVSGSQQAIDIVARMLIKPGDKVVVGDPTYPGAISSFKRAGANIISIPIEKDGMDLKRLKFTLKKERDIKFIYIITNFQNPTGVCWSKVKKLELLNISGKHNIRILEDDCMSEIYFSTKKPKSLKVYDKKENVIYIKSFSKIFMPGLRFAFMLLPKDLSERAKKLKYTSDISSSGWTQRTFYEYLNNGNIESHLEKIRNIFKKRHAYMERLLKKNSRLKIVYSTSGGLFFWIELPEWMDGEKISKKASENGLLLFTGSRFFQKNTTTSFLRISFAGVSEKDIKRGIDILNECIQKY